MHNDILSIPLCISKFQTDILNQGILKDVFTFVRTIKHNLTDWIILKPKFQIEFIEGESFIPNHPTHGNCRILKNMAPKKDKQPLRSINSKDSHSALSEKFAPFYDHFEIADSSSHFNHHITSPSTNRDIDSSSESLPFVEDSLPTNPSFNNANTLSDYINCIFEWQGRYETLERKLELVDFHKLMLKAQASFSPLENGEKNSFTPLVNEKLSKDEQECIFFRMFHQRNEFLSTLKPDVYHLICEKARSSAEQKLLCLRIPPKPISEASVSTILKAL